MTIQHRFLPHPLALAGGAAMLAAALIGLAPRAQAIGEAAPPAVVATPVPTGMGRIWVYREYEPWESLATPYVRLNGAVVGVSEPGAAFYRNVSPGTYTVTVESEGRDVNQFATIVVAAGQQVFVRVLVSSSWDSGGGGGNMGGASGWARPTFYTWQVQPQAAEAAISTLPLRNGS